MKIVFFGSPDAALPVFKKILESGHQVELVITQPDRPSGRGKHSKSPPVKNYAREHGIPVFQPSKIRKDEETLDRLKDIQPEINVAVAYGQIIPSSIIYLPKYNSINLHFSLLPKYRGAAPVQWALLNGENKTGVTVFELNEKMDAGDILTQQEVDILPGENAQELESRLADIGAELMVRTIARIPEIKHQKQNHGKATYAPLLKKTDGKIDWSRQSQRVESMVRAFIPWPSPFTFLEGTRIKILKGHALQERSAEIPPGRIINAGKQGIDVVCGEGSVFRIKELQPENKGKMSAYSFSLGGKAKAGQVFSG